MEEKSARAEQIQTLLRELHGVLEERGKIDASLEQVLRDVLHEVQEALERAHPEERVPKETSLEARFEALALEFEAAHPILAGLLNRLTHQLASLGI